MATNCHPPLVLMDLCEKKRVKVNFFGHFRNLFTYQTLTHVRQILTEHEQISILCVLSHVHREKNLNVKATFFSIQMLMTKS